MPDPLDALLYELWVLCVTFAIDGREAGPLELLGVSSRWERLLLDTPSLWSQIYIRNGEDEIARISIFLYFSRECLFHVDIMITLPTMDSLHLIAAHVSRVATISIRPGASDSIAALPMERWNQVASYILARLSNGLVALDVLYTSCYGISLWEKERLYYCIILMQFTMVNKPNDPDKQICNTPVTGHSKVWEEEITRTTRIFADADANARANSVYSLVRLASYAQHHGAIRIAIPSCIKLLKDADYFVQSATIHALHKLTVHVELRETLGLAVPLLIKILESRDAGIRPAAASLLGKLAEQEETHERLRLVIPALATLVESWHSGIQSTAISLLGKLAEYDELHEALSLTIPVLVQLELWECEIQSAVVSLLGKLAEYAELREALRLTIPMLIQLLEYWHPDVVVASVSLLKQLIRHDDLREAMRLAIPVLVKLLKDSNLSIRFAADSLLGRLAEHIE